MRVAPLSSRLGILAAVTQQVCIACEDSTWLEDLEAEALSCLKAAPPLAELHEASMWNQVGRHSEKRTAVGSVLETGQRRSYSIEGKGLRKAAHLRNKALHTTVTPLWGVGKWLGSSAVGIVNRRRLQASPTQCALLVGLKSVGQSLCMRVHPASTCA